MIEMFMTAGGDMADRVHAMVKAHRMWKLEDDPGAILHATAWQVYTDNILAETGNIDSSL